MEGEPMCSDSTSGDPAGGDRAGEWAVLGDWLGSRRPLREVNLSELRACLGFVGRARASLAALEADLVGEIARREGDAAAEEILRRDQKRSRAGARKTVKVAAQLEWAPGVAEKLADGAITPEAAGLILDAAAEAPVDQDLLLDAAQAEADDLFRQTLKKHLNERTSEQELEERRARQRNNRRASITEQPDGMFHLFAQLDPLVGNRVRSALIAKSNELFRQEDPKERSTPPQRFADALEALICTGDGGAALAGAELIVLADYDLVHERIANARLTDGTRLTEQEALAVACDAKILPGIFNKHTGNALLGRSQRKVSPRLRKRLVVRDGGCIGCGASEKICQVHHVDHWCDHGETTYENTCLLCWRCHQVRVHRHGEEVTRHPNGTFTLGPPNTDGTATGGSTPAGGRATTTGAIPSPTGRDAGSPARPSPHHRHRAHRGTATTRGPDNPPPRATR